MGDDFHCVFARKWREGLFNSNNRNRERINYVNRTAAIHRLRKRGGTRDGDRVLHHEHLVLVQQRTYPGHRLSMRSSMYSGIAHCCRVRCCICGGAFCTRRHLHSVCSRLVGDSPGRALALLCRTAMGNEIVIFALKRQQRSTSEDGESVTDQRYSAEMQKKAPKAPEIQKAEEG